MRCLPEIEGTVVKVLPKVTGTTRGGKEWTKWGFLLKEDGGSEVYFIVWNKCTSERLIKVGAMLEVSFSVRSREWNGNYITEAVASVVAKVDKFRVIESTHADWM